MIVYPDGRIEHVQRPMCLRDIQTMVGGWVQGIVGVAWVDEEGRLKNKNANPVADAMLIAATGRAPNGGFVGTVVFATNTEGDEEVDSGDEESKEKDFMSAPVFKPLKARVYARALLAGLVAAKETKQ